MSTKELKHFDILEARKAYAQGQNVTELLRSQKNVSGNTPEIIETAYDLQAGTYIDYVTKNPKQASSYTAELAQILDEHITSDGTLLDVGTGELTTLSMVIGALKNHPSAIYAFDISWSRIHKGTGFAQKTLGPNYQLLTPFVADISEIPLRDKSIHITTSSHALEPNGGKLRELLRELFRVTIETLVLFEPCYEINSEEGKQRMDKLGYIKNMDGVVAELGGKLVEKTVIKNTTNPLNPTVCFVIKPPPASAPSAPPQNSIFSVPGTNMPLVRMDDFYYSIQTGLCYPAIKNIPILKSNCAVLATSLGEYIDCPASQ